MSLQNAKIFGGIGSILPFVSSLLGIVLAFGFIFLPFIAIVNIVISLIGWILILLAIKIISDEAKDRSIFTNYLTYVIIGIIGTIIATIFVGGTIGLGFLSSFEKMSEGEMAEGATGFLETFAGAIVLLIIFFIIVYVIQIVAAVFLKRSFDGIAKHTKVELFRTTGLLYLIGAILLILFGIGGIITFIAAILQIVAFFSLPDTLPEPTPAAPSPSTSIEEEKRVCLNCGRLISLKYNHCPYCGAEVKKEPEE